jgi:hypothetical protein
MRSGVSVALLDCEALAEAAKVDLELSNAVASKCKQGPTHKGEMFERRKATKADDLFGGAVMIEDA